MDSDCLIEDLLCQAHSHCHCEALHDLTGIGACVMQSYNLIPSFINNCFRIDGVLETVSFLIILLQDFFLKRIVPDMVDLDILSTKDLDCLFLAHPASRVL